MVCGLSHPRTVGFRIFTRDNGRWPLLTDEHHLWLRHWPSPFFPAPLLRASRSLPGVAFSVSAPQILFLDFSSSCLFVLSLPLVLPSLLCLPLLRLRLPRFSLRYLPSGAGAGQNLVLLRRFGLGVESENLLHFRLQKRSARVWIGWRFSGSIDDAQGQGYELYKPA